MRYRDFLENVRAAPLYHSTNPEAAIWILGDDTIVPGDLGRPARINGKSVRGISFTRSLRFAKAFNDCILEFDQDLIRREIGKTIPYIDTNISKMNDFGDQRREAEEFLPGPLNNVSKFLTGIYLERSAVQEIMSRPKRADDLDHAKQIEAIQAITKLPLYKGLI